MSYEPKYTDLRLLVDGTRFRVDNGNWIGSIFSKDGQKYMHIDETGVDKLLTGDEQLIVSVLPKKKVSDREALANLKYSIKNLPFTMFDHKEVFDRQEVLKLVNNGDNPGNYNVPIQNAIIVPANATYGDMIKAILNPYKICEYEYNVHVYMTEKDFQKADYQINCSTSLWNKPCKTESKGI